MLKEETLTLKVSIFPPSLKSEKYIKNILYYLNYTKSFQNTSFIEYMKLVFKNIYSTIGVWELFKQIFTSEITYLNRITLK